MEIDVEREAERIDEQVRRTSKRAAEQFSRVGSVGGRAESGDGAIQVEPEAAKEWARRCAREEGLLVGISSGATLAAIAQKLKDLPAGSRVLGFNYDTGERYLSVPDFLPE